jgi:hypothetical protein
MGVGVMVELKVEELANTIRKLSKSDKEMLFLMLSGENREIVRRVKDVKSKKVKPLTREDAFRDVL